MDRAEEGAAGLEGAGAVVEAVVEAVVDGLEGGWDGHFTHTTPTTPNPFQSDLP